MKFLSAQISHFFADARLRTNLRALFKFAAILASVVVVFTVVFHMIMVYHEDKGHSWLTGLYWTLTVMSTLGFGDITFESDLGRVFTVVVLISGIFLLLIMLPFAFIRFFYAPWIETELKLRAPRKLAASVRDHVLVCLGDPIGRDLVEQLALLKIPHYVLVEDHREAAELHAAGVSVVCGDPAFRSTWEGMQLHNARAVVANADDATNTNITLTVRDLAPDVMIVSTVDDDDSIDILELAGASEVLPVKRRLGEQLANRVNAGHAEAHQIGAFEEFIIAEFPVHGTPLIGRSIRDLELRRRLGVTIVGVWQRGVFSPVLPEMVLGPHDVLVVIGTPAHISNINELLVIYDTNYNPTIVIGGGKVGCAAARTLRARDIPVHIVERDESLVSRIEGVADRLIVGNAADRTVLIEAGIEKAPAVLLTTNDDSINVYLAVYCRRLNPELRIISRMTKAENVEAVHRAGADFALSDSLLGAESALSAVQGRELMMLGAGADLFHARLPDEMAGKSLAEIDLRRNIGLNVIAVRSNGNTDPNPAPNRPLEAGSELLLIGNTEQHAEFVKRYE